MEQFEDSVKVFLYNKDFDIVVGDNGTGKTTVVRFLLSGIDKNKVFVLNASGQRWDFPKKNIFRPYLYSNDWFNKFAINFMAKHSNCTLVLDDVDNFKIKHNEYLRSMIINARHLNIGVVLSVRQLQDIDRLIYKQSKMFIAQQTVDYDVLYAMHFMPYAMAQHLSTLPPYTFVNYYPAKKQGRLFKVPDDFAKKWDSYTKGGS